MNRKQKRLLIWAGACLLILATVVFGSLSFSTSYNYCVGHNGEHATGQYDQDGAPIIEVALPGKPSGFSLFVYCSGVYTDQNAGAITAVATLLLMFITAGLVFLGYLQFGTSRTQLRAYVAVDAISLSDGNGDLWQHWPRANLIIKNTGETPAKNVRNWTHIDVAPIVDYPNLGAIQFDDKAPSNIPAGGSTFINDLYMGRQLAANEIVAIQARQLAVYVYGIIKYVDVFGIDRETAYRLLHTGSWPPAANTILYFAKNGNDFT